VRILIIVHQFYPEYSGGTEKVTFGLAKLAQKAGHFVRVLTCVTGELNSDTWEQGCSEYLWDTTYQGIPVSAIRSADIDASAEYSLGHDVPLVGQISQLLELENYDVCHVMHAMRMASAIQAVQNCNIPYILSLTDFYLPCYRINYIRQEGNLCGGSQGGVNCGTKCLLPDWRPAFFLDRYSMAQKIVELAQYVVCPSEYVAALYSQEFPDAKFKVVAHGIDLSLCRIRENDHKVDEIVFGYLGSIGPVKGLEILIEAFQQVVGDNLRLNICGGFVNDDGYEKTIRNLVSLDERVNLLPAVNPREVFDVLQTFDLLCIPSVVPETFSLVFHEAMAAQVPAMVSALGAPQYHIETYQCGSVVPAGDRRAWTVALETVAERPELLASWRDELPLPLRIEEEAFIYQTLYLQSTSQTSVVD
jgi:glycosyltransferase involved in cell wall biosynthesis|tara:strand:+ start:5259 stop:6512 length:1254 start_codon:yes stop_codon:yes gene_type:complete